MQDEVESSNSLLGNCFHILAPPSRLYKTLLPWSLPTNGSWTVQLTAGEQAKQESIREHPGVAEPLEVAATNLILPATPAHIQQCHVSMLTQELLEG